MATLTIKSKNFGIIKINSNTFNPMFASVSSPIFKLVEHMFNDWYEHHTQKGAPCCEDIILCYEGDIDQPAIYSKKGAIRQAIENLVEYMTENNITFLTTKEIYKADLEAAFQI